MKRFQFTIRDLLFVVALLALVAGWWADHQRINRLAVQKWDYMSHAYLGEYDLKLAGDQGWELCGTMDEFDGKTHTPIIVLKRPK